MCAATFAGAQVGLSVPMAPVMNSEEFATSAAYPRLTSQEGMRLRRNGPKTTKIFFSSLEPWCQVCEPEPEPH